MVCIRIKLSDFSKSIKGTQSVNKTVGVSGVMISKSREVKEQSLFLNEETSAGYRAALLTNWISQIAVPPSTTSRFYVFQQKG